MCKIQRLIKIIGIRYYILLIIAFLSAEYGEHVIFLILKEWVSKDGIVQEKLKSSRKTKKCKTGIQN